MKKTNIKICHRYMILPINQNAKRKRIFFYENDVLVWDFDASIDFINPSYYTYLDIRHLMGKELYLSSSPAIKLNFDFCDEVPKGVGENQPYRPAVHFTARYGWINDPNGLVYVNSNYHLFFQYNPTDVNWGNMTWGHAISKDLIHWEQLENALIPDELGTMFSGSGIIDKNNVSNLGTKENPPVLFYYTAAGNNSAISAGKGFVQGLAYSLDGGITLKKYENNPVLEEFRGGNRDPKLIWCEELKAYVMALYIESDEYAIFTSDDLISFKLLQTIDFLEDTECPDIYPLDVENGQNEKKWVLSGAADKYVIGEFASGKFNIIQKSKPYSHSKDNLSYAAQTFSDIPDRRVKIAWHRFTAPNSCFTCQMSIPTEVSLCRVGDEYRLRTVPCREFESIRGNSMQYDVSSSDFSVSLSKNAYDILLELDKDCDDTELNFFGHKFVICPSKNTLYFSNSEMPLTFTKEKINIRIISDTLGCEVFADNGLIYSVLSETADYNIDSLTFSPVSENGVPKLKLTVYELERI